MPSAKLRSKTGCFKCRTRRIKCDEKHPQCTACSRWNFTCTWPSTADLMRDGRLAVVTRTRHTEKIAKESHPDEHEDLESRTSEISVFRHGPSWDGEERQAFEFFRLETSNVMSGVFQTDGEMNIWSRMLLQGAHQSPQIKHAICALGALHQLLQNEPDACQGHQGRTYLLATQQYNKAIQSTLRCTNHKRMSLDAALIMCVLFTFLERFLGDVRTAMSHLQAGMKLLTSNFLRSAHPVPSPRSPSETTCVPRATITVLMRRLERQILELGRTRLLPDAPQTFSLQVDIPASFVSLEDAITSFEMYFNDTLNLMHTCEWRHEEQDHVSKPVEPDLAFFLRRMMTKWTEAFMSFLHNANLNAIEMSEAEQSMVHTLHLERLVLSATLAHYQTGDEMIWDTFIPEFAEAVAHGEAIIRAQRRASELEKSKRPTVDSMSSVWESNSSIEPQSSSSYPSISVEHAPPGTSQQIHMKCPSEFAFAFSPFSLIPPIWTITWRCRDPGTRRHAMRLLKDIDWRDVFWDSRLAYTFAERFIQIEENGYLAGQRYGQYNPPIERAEQVLPAARCSQLRIQLEKAHVYIVDFINASVDGWVPGPDPLSDTFWEVGRIREKWIISNYKGRTPG